MIALGRDQGGYLGQVLGGAVGVAIGATGSTILGALLLLVGALLLSGASLGAILRRTRTTRFAAPRAPRRVALAARHLGRPRSRRRRRAREGKKPVVDAEEAFPTSSPRAAPRRAPLHVSLEPRAARHPAGAALRGSAHLFEDVTTEHAEYKLPDRNVLQSRR